MNRELFVKIFQIDMPAVVRNRTGGTTGASAPSSAANNKGNNSRINIDKLSEESRALYMLITAKLEAAMRDLEDKLVAKEARVDQLELQVRDARKQNAELSERIDELEMRERASTLILSGNNIPLVAAQENVSNVVGEIFKSKLKIEMRAGDMIGAFRVGKKPATQKADKRSIIVKFKQREMRDDILRSAKNVKPDGLFINENLTPVRSDILYRLRQSKRLHPDKVDGCGSVGGRVYVWLKCEGSPNTKLYVNSLSKLDEILVERVGMSAGPLNGSPPRS